MQIPHTLTELAPFSLFMEYEPGLVLYHSVLHANPKLMNLNPQFQLVVAFIWDIQLKCSRYILGNCGQECKMTVSFFSLILLIPCQRRLILDMLCALSNPDGPA